MSSVKVVANSKIIGIGVQLDEIDQNQAPDMSQSIETDKPTPSEEVSHREMKRNGDQKEFNSISTIENYILTHQDLKQDPDSTEGGQGQQKGPTAEGNQFDQTTRIGRRKNSNCRGKMAGAAQLGTRQAHQDGELHQGKQFILV